MIRGGVQDEEPVCVCVCVSVCVCVYFMWPISYMLDDGLVCNIEGQTFVLFGLTPEKHKPALLY